MGLFVEIQMAESIRHVIWWIVTSYISLIISGICDVYTFDQLFNVNSSRKQKIKFLLTSINLKFLGMMLIVVPYYRIASIIIAIICYNKIFHKSMEKCFIAELINLLSLIVLEVLISKVLVNCFPMFSSFKDGMYNFCYKFLSASLVVMFRWIIYFIMKKLKFTIKMTDSFSNNSKRRIILLVFVGMGIAFFNSVEAILYVNAYPFMFFAVDLIAMITYLFISIRNVVELSLVEEQEKELQSLGAYNKTITIMYDNLRGFKHDYSNFVQALNGYAQTNNIDGIKRMCSSVMEECQNINSLGVLDPKLIDNASIYSLITNKYYKANEFDIKMNIEVFANFSMVVDEIYEVCRILSILLDNAIEAARDSNEKIINFMCMRDDCRKCLIVKIENSYGNEEIDIGRIFEKGYTTKEDLNHEHGLGLWTVRKILSKSKTLNLDTQKNEMFCQELEIY